MRRPRLCGAARRCKLVLLRRCFRTETELHGRGRQRDLGGRPFRWMTVGQPELGIAHVAQAVGVPIGEQCTREVLHYMFDNESSGSSGVK